MKNKIMKKEKICAFCRDYGVNKYCQCQSKNILEDKEEIKVVLNEVIKKYDGKKIAKEKEIDTPTNQIDYF